MHFQILCLQGKEGFWGKKQNESCLARLLEKSECGSMLIVDRSYPVLQLENKVDRQMAFLLLFSPEDFY